MSYRKKTWQEKMADKKSLPKFLNLQSGFPCYPTMKKMGVTAGERVVLVNPVEVAEVMRQVPKGKIATIYEICRALAAKYKVKGCCSLTTGIFIMTAANAAEEAAAGGQAGSWSYWRTTKAEGFLNEKYPGGAMRQKELLEKEGFKVLARGKKYAVANYQDFLFQPKV